MKATQALCVFAAPLLLSLVASAQVYLENGLVAKFDLNGDTLDSSGNGHDAPVSGAHSFVTDRFGIAGGAFQIDAPGVWAQGSGMTLSGTSLSLSFWYLKYWDPLDRAIIRVGTESAAGKQLIVQLDYPITSQADLRFTFFYNDLDYFAAPSQSIDEWYHAVLTYDEPSHERLIYIDGSLVLTDVAAYGFSGGDYFDFGMYGVALDDLAFYNRVLTPDEVNALYNVPEPTSPSFLMLGVLFLMRKRRQFRD